MISKVMLCDTFMTQMCCVKKSHDDNVVFLFFFVSVFS